MEKLRVLFLITDLGKGGAERFLIDLCSELKKRGDVEFIIGSLYDNNQYKTQTANFKVVNLNFHTFSLRGKNENLTYKNLLDTFKPHIVHTHRFLAEFLSSYYVNPEIVYVTHGHDNMEQLRNFQFKDILNKQAVLQYLEKRHLVAKKYNKTSTHFVANSEDTKKYFERSLPAGMKQNIHLIHCGFNYSRFADFPAKPIEPSSIKLLNVGSFQEKKNQIFLVEIAKELKRRNIPFEINVLGQGATFETVKEAIVKNGLEENIILHGMVDQIQDWYASSHIYLHVAKYEPFGLVFLEAMASGKPVVTLDGKGNRDIIKNGENGFIHPNEDPAAFADSIETLMKDTVLYKTISNTAKTFSQTFDAPLKTAELVNFYQKVVNDKGQS